MAEASYQQLVQYDSSTGVVARSAYHPGAKQAGRMQHTAGGHRCQTAHTACGKVCLAAMTQLPHRDVAAMRPHQLLHDAEPQAKPAVSAADAAVHLWRSTPTPAQAVPAPSPRWRSSCVHPTPSSAWHNAAWLQCGSGVWCVLSMPGTVKSNLQSHSQLSVHWTHGPGPDCTACRGATHLLKREEDGAELLLGDANAAVQHIHRHLLAALITPASTHSDVATCRELAGVAQQVVKDL